MVYEYLKIILAIAGTACLVTLGASFIYALITLVRQEDDANAAIITITDKPDKGLKIKLNFKPSVNETPAQNAAMVMLRLFQKQAAEIGIPQQSNEWD